MNAINCTAEPLPIRPDLVTDVHSPHTPLKIKLISSWKQYQPIISYHMEHRLKISSQLKYLPLSVPQGNISTGTHFRTEKLIAHGENKVDIY